MAYIPHTPDDVREMLAAIKLRSLDELFDVVPDEVRLRRLLAVPPALSELELTAHLSELAAQNAGSDQKPCFLGGGSYDHFVPAAVDQLAGRGEFFTAYTPYQAEASQGTLQAIFEYQTLVTQLTGLDVSNASLYDGGSAVAEAVVMALAASADKQRVVLAGSIHPEYAQSVRTILANVDAEIVTAPAKNGRFSPDELAAAITDDTAGVVIQYPNFFGQLEDVDRLVKCARDRGALAIVSVDPISLGVLLRPAEYGADIVVAEGQSLGNHLAYGGPYLGIIACREQFMRKMPGRIVGQTTDRTGKRCWVLTLQTREQHIRRAKATSNICTNQGLLALRASIYLALMGPTGLRRAATLSAIGAHSLAAKLASIPGVSLAFDGPFFKEFAIRVRGDAKQVLSAVSRLGYHGGVWLGQWSRELGDCILIAVTEKRTESEIEGLAAAYRKALASG